MEKESYTFLEDMLTTPSPSGYEQPIQKVVREYSTPFSDDVSTDWHGNVIAAVNPDSRLKIMLAGHCDQIGLLVNHIDNEGFLRVAPIGGWDVQMLIGQNMQVWTKSGPISGIIARKAIHLLKPDERKVVPELKDLWIDIGVADGNEAKELVQIGDPVTLELGVRKLRNGMMFSPGMDNKVGAWVCISALQRFVEKGKSDAGVFAVSTVQEEIGLRGARTSAFSIDPQLGIAVDVTHATDCPTIDENELGTCKIGAGPVLFRGPNVNPVMFEQLTEIAKTQDIPIQVSGLSKAASNDGNAMQISRGGLATAIIGIPNRYMHSPVEVISLDDLDHAATLIAEFCLTLKKESDFTP